MTTLREALDMWEARRAETPEVRVDVGAMVCPWCQEVLRVLKPAGGCLIGQVAIGTCHAQCCDEYEAQRERS